MYTKGNGVEQSHKNAVRWFRKSAKKGDGNAQYALGLMYKNGAGVEQSDRTANNWWEKSAEQGNSKAQKALGNPSAVELAELGFVDAQFLLGMSYFLSDEGEQSDETGFKWVEKSAEQGHISAQKLLSRMYKDGYGVEQSDEKAAMWMKKANGSPVNQVGEFKF